MPINTQRIPSRPGCYIFKNANGDILYIGKAKNLKKRVASYFSKTHDNGKTQQLVAEISSIDYIITRDEVEALVVEAKLIRDNQPKYNIDLKGGERYAYIRITNEKFPRLETARLVRKGDKVFGPYTNAEARKQAIRLANSLFVLRVCKNKKGRPCLLHHIGLCACPYATGMSEREYKRRLDAAVMFLKGEVKPLMEKLAKEMNLYSAKKDYEHAKVRRDQILALENISQHKPAQLQKTYNQDVVNFVDTPKRLVVQVFNINKGVISGKKQFSVRRRKGDEPVDLFGEFIKQYYYSHDIPAEIIIPQKISEHSLVEKYLQKRAEKKVRLFVPAKGDKVKLLELLKENIKASLKSGSSTLLDLQNTFSLSTLPRHIECFDISNLGAEYKVGSMVHFKDGKPDKSQYRRFKIKTVSGQSDYDSMREIVFRRYYRLKKENAELPQLVMIDGGKPQLSAAVSVLKELGLQIPLIALAKRFEEIYTLHNTTPLRLSRKSPTLKLLQKIRDEAHRFAITYHRLLRSKQITSKS